MRKTVISLVILLALFNALAISSDVPLSKSYPVSTLLNAKWGATPIALEVAEYLADENIQLFWEYVENYNKLEVDKIKILSESKLYKLALQAADPLISESQMSLLKLALSMHSYSPRVQAHFQIAKETLIHDKCSLATFIEIGGQVACNIPAFENIRKKSKYGEQPIHTLDHIYPGSENNSITAILYGEIGTNEFKTFHLRLKELALAGDMRYMFRHFIKKPATKSIRLSGYGVEMQLKSTEYKSQDDSPHAKEGDSSETSVPAEMYVQGFNFSVLNQRYPDLTHSLEEFRRNLLNNIVELPPLKAWEFQDLGMQAAQRISEIQGEEALQILQFTAQNFPTQAKSLLSVKVSNDLKDEMAANIEVLRNNLNLQPPDAALFVNGLFFDVETLDVGLLFESLRSELRVIDGLHKLNVNGALASNLLGINFVSSSTQEFAIDIRDSSIVWLNDIEKDARYNRFPSSVTDLLRPTFPGMLRSVRKNLFNLVLVFDPVMPYARDIVKTTYSFIEHTAPLRVGIVFDMRNATAATQDDYRAMLCAFNYASQKKNALDGFELLSEIYSAVKSKDNVLKKDVITRMKKRYSKLSVNDIEDVLGEDSDFDYGRQLSEEFVDKLGARSTQVLLNGVPLNQAMLNDNDYEELILTEIMHNTQVIQKQIFRGEITDSDDVVDVLMGMPHVMPRLNQRILETENNNYLDLSGVPHDIENVKALATLSNRDMTATLMKNLKYFESKLSDKISSKKLHSLTLWIIADVTTPSGASLLTNALNFMKSSRGIRVAFIPNTEGTITRKNLNNLIWAASQALEGEEATNVALKWLAAKKEITDIPAKIDQLLSSASLHLKLLRVYCQRVLHLSKSVSTVIVNGKQLGAFREDETFTNDDFGLLDRLSSVVYGDKLKTVLKQSVDFSNHIDMEEEITDLELSSDTIMKMIGMLMTREPSRNRFTIPKELRSFHSAVLLPPMRKEIPFFDIVAVLDPASKGAQKLAPILILLRNVINCNMKVFMAAVDKHSDMPVKNFYRFVIEPEIQFTPDGRSAIEPMAKFTGLPINTLLTQNLQVPENWMVEVVHSVYDLDNIKLSEIKGSVHSEYELEYLLLEGHCFDATSGAPPRGLQITLGTEDNPIIVDTIVMANLGYFQLKANPGAWVLRLRHGKSADIYDITSVDGQHTLHSQESGSRIIIASLRSHVIKMRVTKKPDQQNADLLGEDDGNNGIWNSITSSFGGSSSDEDTTINIFSLASGHLYERLMRIMMLSVLKHTKEPVKFWFLKNYLSPQFIEVLPYMAKEYNFKYELVQYKWPRWLHQQTEKQRIIWGYKILFLDVLFPLDVRKIIFVDADAIVRGDLKDLYNLDLNGAPYAYTPFCDSRTEMEGFRFWKQGYWRNHLQGRKYHISALYVVDLKRFRKIAAGDRLRGQYQALSQDPNSLSNLDQDLPNNMIHQVPIKSLPQEWLWCQTWCSDDNFSRAKVIDLCNNPQTKEAKLTAAQRIVPEWTTYDQEIKQLMTRKLDEEQEQAMKAAQEEDKKSETDPFEQEIIGHINKLEQNKLEAEESSEHDEL